MKTTRLIFALLLSVTASAVLAQSKTEKLYDAFRNKPGINYFAFSKNLTNAFNIDLDKEGKSIEGDISEVRLLSYNPAKGKLSTDEFIQKSTDLLPASAKLVETDKDDNAQIWMLGNRKKASEFHIFIGGDKPESMSFLISFYGDFNIKDLDDIKAMGRDMANDN